MEYYTTGQAIDKLGMDEVAIRVDGEVGKCNIYNCTYLTTGFHYDKNDNNILKTLEGNELVVAKAVGDLKKTLFAIMPRETYEKILNT